MNIWYNVLVPHLPGVLQDLKNKMTQKFRGQHESKIFSFVISLKLYHLTIISFVV